MLRVLSFLDTVFIQEMKSKLVFSLWPDMEKVKLLQQHHFIHVLMEACACCPSLLVTNTTTRSVCPLVRLLITDFRSAKPKSVLKGLLLMDRDNISLHCETVAVGLDQTDQCTFTMANRLSLSPSWIAPFLLGAVSAYSLAWISNHLVHAKQERKDETKKGLATKPHRSLTFTQDQNNDDLMDTPDLDNRMLRKAEAIVQWRTSRLLLVIERSTNDHNYSSIMRTAEALGVQHVWTIDPPTAVGLDEEEEEADFKLNLQNNGTKNGASQSATPRTPEEREARKLHHLFAQNALEWLSVRDFATTEECIQALREENYKLWVTDLSQEAKSLTTNDDSHCKLILPHIKVALVMGTEAVGCSQTFLDSADLRVYLPLRGFADSLNLSVATALIVHQLFVMDPTLIGDMPPRDRRELRRLWFTKLCTQRILTSRQKKDRTKLLSHIRRCQIVYDRTVNDPSYVLQPAEKAKLDKWEGYKQKLQAIEALVDPTAAEKAVQEFIDKPPEPLTDVRRADDHRACYVGKGTKAKHESHWNGMVATSQQTTIYGATSTLFRQKMEEATRTKQEA